MNKHNFLRVLFSLVLIAAVSTLAYQVGGIAPIQTAGALLATGFVIGILKYRYGFSTNMNLGNLYTGITLTDTTYAGEAASQFIIRAMTDNVMVNGGHMYVKDGIKKQYTIPRWDITFEDFVQDVKATPTPGLEKQTVTGQQLITKEYMVYHEFNPRDYEDHWFAAQIQGNTLIESEAPATVESVIVSEVLKRNGAFVNKLAWNGNTSLTTKMKYVDGFKTKATAASGTVKTGSTTTLTSSNIATEFQKGYAVIPTALKYAALANNNGTTNSRLKYFVSPTTFDLYCQYQIAQTNKGVDTTQIGVPKYRGIDVVPIPDLPNDYYMIAVGQPDMGSNLWMGMNSTDDANNIQLAKLQANSELWFIKMLAKIDFQIGWNEETVTYE